MMGARLADTYGIDELEGGNEVERGHKEHGWGRDLSQHPPFIPLSLPRVDIPRRSIFELCTEYSCYLFLVFLYQSYLLTHFPSHDFLFSSMNTHIY